MTSKQRTKVIWTIILMLSLAQSVWAVEEYVLTLDGQEVRFTAVPDQGRVVKDESGRIKAERQSLAQDIKLHSMQATSAKVSYRAPLFSVNGQTVGVTPEIVVRVTTETSREELGSLCTTMGLRLIRPMPFTTHECVLEVVGPDAEAVFTAVQALNETESIEWAWPNLILCRDPDPEPRKVSGEFSCVASATAAASDVPDNNTFMEPNDPFFPDLWHLHNTGQTGGTPGADINALAAWEITTGDPNIVVAVVDTGVDMNHPDLAAALVPGYDFWDDDDWPHPLPTYGDAHGTMCAGLIGAQGNNDIGVVGVAWNCKIMPVRIDAWGYTPHDEAAIATSLRWAAVNGVDVVSNSWYFIIPLPIIHSAIKDISQSGGGIGRDGKGCTVVFAGGNDGSAESFYYPASYPEVIVVGGTDHYDRRVNYSNYGPELDIVAPSGSEPFSEELALGCIWTTDISGPSGWNTAPSGPYIPYPWAHIYDYGQSFGTSFATPLVAGVAALILSVEPELSNEDVRHYLTRSARDLGEPGKDDYYGWGRLDARAALDMVLAKRADLNDDWTVDEQDLALLDAYIAANDLSGDIAPAAKRDGTVDALDMELAMEYCGIEIPEPGLIAHWNLDEAEGVTAHDTIAGRDGTLQGDPLWQPDAGMVRGALQLDGIDDCVETAMTVNPGEGPFSVSAWVKGGAPGEVIVSQSGGANWLMVRDGGVLAAGFSDVGVHGDLISSVEITDGTWHHVGIVWDSGARALYVDDVKVAEDVQRYSVNQDTVFYLGACGPGGRHRAVTFFAGLIDDVRIYNRAVRP